METRDKLIERETGVSPGVRDIQLSNEETLFILKEDQHKALKDLSKGDIALYGKRSGFKQRYKIKSPAGGEEIAPLDVIIATANLPTLEIQSAVAKLIVEELERLRPIQRYYPSIMKYTLESLLGSLTRDWG